MSRAVNCEDPRGVDLVKVRGLLAGRGAYVRISYGESIMTLKARLSPDLRARYPL
jgi:hypothetical protein